MHQKAICIAIIVLITVMILIVTRITGEEAFASKTTKAQAIYDWFKDNSAPAYIDYKHYMGMRSNIVEYEDVLNLVHSGELTIDSVMAAI